MPGNSVLDGRVLDPAEADERAERDARGKRAAASDADETRADTETLQFCDPEARENEDAEPRTHVYTEGTWRDRVSTADVPTKGTVASRGAPTRRHAEAEAARYTAEPGTRAAERGT